MPNRNVYLTSLESVFWFAEKSTNACINWNADVYARGGSPTNIAQFFTANDALQWLNTQPNLSLVSFPHLEGAGTELRN